MSEATNRTRAAMGESVGVTLNPILPEKREQFERLITEILTPAAEQHFPRQAQSFRFLVPSEPDESGNFTFVFLFDPYFEDADYTLKTLLTTAFGADEAESYLQQWNECFAGPQVAYLAKQR